MNYVAMPGIKLNIPDKKVETIVFAVSQVTGISMIQMRAASRQREFVETRWIAMHLIRKHTQWTLVAVAKLFGGRDHSSVIHGIQRLQELIKMDVRVINTIQLIESKL